MLISVHTAYCLSQFSINISKHDFKHRYSFLSGPNRSIRPDPEVRYQYVLCPLDFLKDEWFPPSTLPVTAPESLAPPKTFV